MPKAVCKEKMQNTQLHNNEVIIEYITDAQGNRVKKLNPVFIKSELDREHILWMDSDNNLPAIPEKNFTRERERTVDSYSESISSENDPSDERPITADSDSSAAVTFEETSIRGEADPAGTKDTLHQIVTGLRNAAEGYLPLASHMSRVVPYELPQVIAQIPPPPMDVPFPIRKALLIDGENKVVDYLIHGKYELANTSWSKLQKKYHISRDKIYITVKGKRRPRGLQY